MCSDEELFAGNTRTVTSGFAIWDPSTSSISPPTTLILLSAVSPSPPFSEADCVIHASHLALISLKVNEASTAMFPGGAAEQEPITFRFFFNRLRAVKAPGGWTMPPTLIASPAVWILMFGECFWNCDRPPACLRGELQRATQERRGKRVFKCKGQELYDDTGRQWLSVVTDCLALWDSHVPKAAARTRRSVTVTEGSKGWCGAGCIGTGRNNCGLFQLLNQRPYCHAYQEAGCHPWNPQIAWRGQPRIAAPLHQVHPSIYCLYRCFRCKRGQREVCGRGKG